MSGWTKECGYMLLLQICFSLASRCPSLTGNPGWMPVVSVSPNTSAWSVHSPYTQIDIFNLIAIRHVRVRVLCVCCACFVVSLSLIPGTLYIFYNKTDHEWTRPIQRPGDVTGYGIHVLILVRPLRLLQVKQNSAVSLQYSARYVSLTFEEVPNTATLSTPKPWGIASETVLITGADGRT